MGFESKIPVILVDNFGTGEFSDTNRSISNVWIFDTGNGNSEISDSPPTYFLAGVRLRGSGSLSWPKKSLDLQAWDENGTEIDVAPLGMPPDSEWVLVGPYSFDKSLMRNVVVYQIARQAGIPAMRAKLVEVFVNRDDTVMFQSDYNGVYAFIEKIKRGKDRVDVEKMSKDDNSEPNITGGWMLKIDDIDPDEEGFKTFRGTPARNLIIYKDPKTSKVTEEQKAWIKDWFEEFEDALYGENFTDSETGYAAYIDIDSFIDHHLMQEAFKNLDHMIASTYFFMPRGGKMHMGPLWDFDRSSGFYDPFPNSPTEWRNRDGLWFGRLFEDPAFERRYAQRWLELRRGALSTENVYSVIDSNAKLIEDAAPRDYAKWYGSPQNLSLEVANLKSWIRTRFEWMDSELSA